MKRVPYLALGFLLLATSAVAQENQRAPDRWAGMVLNVSTPDDALRLLGNPAKDKDKDDYEIELVSRTLARQ